MALLSRFESTHNSTNNHNQWNIFNIFDPLPKDLRQLEISLNDDGKYEENLLPTLTSGFSNISKSCLNDIMGIGRARISRCTFNGKYNEVIAKQLLKGFILLYME